MGPGKITIAYAISLCISWSPLETLLRTSADLPVKWGPIQLGDHWSNLARRQDQPRTPASLVRTFPGHDQPRQDQPRRPLAPVLRKATSDILDILGPGLQHPPAPEHVIVLDSPASPDPSPTSSPVNTPPKKERAPPPPVPLTRVLCEGPWYILRQYHQFLFEIFGHVTFFNVQLSDFKVCVYKQN